MAEKLQKEEFDIEEIRSILLDLKELIQDSNQNVKDCAKILKKYEKFFKKKTLCQRMFYDK